jgi:hypothetical protein
MVSTRTETDSRAAALYHPNGDFREWPDTPQKWPDGVHEPQVDQQLQLALEQGKLTAYQVGHSPKPVEPIYWAVNKHWRSSEELLLKRSEIERLWPAAPRHARSRYNRERAGELWFAMKNNCDEPWSMNEAARQLQDAYERKVDKPAPSLPHLERWIKAWGGP